MPAYSVFEPAMRRDGAAERADRFLFVRDRFNFAAFLFGPVWMIWKRQWLVLILYPAMVGLLEYGLDQLGLAIGVRVTIFILVQFLIGIEAAGLQRWTLLLHGWRDCGVVIADDVELAERRFFDARSASAAAAKARSVSAGGPLQMRIEPPAAGFSDGWAKGVS